LWDRLVKERAQFVTIPANPGPNEVKRPLVLIVDPDKEIQNMAKRIIEGLGYGVVVAGDGKRGFELAEEYSPDLVLTEALMPRIDGREMCRLIKESKNKHDIKVAVMTSIYTQKKYQSEAFKRFHVDEYLSKPLKMRDLQSLLQKHLET
jgi:CheY-like chemotaxis protein